MVYTHTCRQDTHNSSKKRLSCLQNYLGQERGGTMHLVGPNSHFEVLRHLKALPLLYRSQPDCSESPNFVTHVLLGSSLTHSNLSSPGSDSSTPHIPWMVLHSSFHKVNALSSNHRLRAKFLLSLGTNNPEVLSDPEHCSGKVGWCGGGE